jgi:hypothetical protein
VDATRSRRSQLVQGTVVAHIHGRGGSIPPAATIQVPTAVPQVRR